jgi:hypothetical protein
LARRVALFGWHGLHHALGTPAINAREQEFSGKSLAGHNRLLPKEYH